MQDKNSRVELRIRRRASEWARSKLDFESPEDSEPQLRQIAVRMPAEDVAFLDALAKRFGVSRNHAIGIFVGSAAADAYEQLPAADRQAIVDQVSETMERPVQVRWVREIELTDEEDALFPEDVKQAMRNEP